MTAFDELIERERISAARHCSDCLGWLDKCHAECCKGFYIVVKDPYSLRRGSILAIFRVLSEDMQKYYFLHGQHYVHGQLKVKLNDFLVVGDDMIFLWAPCKHLTKEGLCAIHESLERPKLCDIPNINQYKDVPSGIRITPNCLFRYKIEGER